MAPPGKAILTCTVVVDVVRVKIVSLFDVTGEEPFIAACNAWSVYSHEPANVNNFVTVAVTRCDRACCGERF